MKRRNLIWWAMFFSFLIANRACAQTASVTYSPQGAEALRSVTGKVIRGEGLTEVTICSTGPKRVPNGLVYQTAVRNGLATMSPVAADLVFNRAAARNWRQFAIDGLADTGVLVSALGVGKVIPLNPSWETGLALGRPTADLIGGIAEMRLKAELPDPKAVEALFLDPAKETVFSAAGCVDTLMVTRYRADQKQLLGPFALE